MQLPSWLNTLDNYAVKATGAVGGWLGLDGNPTTPAKAAANAFPEKFAPSNPNVVAASTAGVQNKATGGATPGASFLSGHTGLIIGGIAVVGLVFALRHK